MKDQSTSKKNQMGSKSLIGLSAEPRDLSNEENNSHGDKDTKVKMSSNEQLNNFLDIYKMGVKKESASGTGYLCDEDDSFDDDFQNQ